MLDSIFHYNDIEQDLEVIIVDNSSKGVSCKMHSLINDTYFNNVKFIKNDRNGGFGYGNNIGIRNAEGKHIAIMNPDITMTEPLSIMQLNNLKKI